jgi:Xaa-Pro dipeptidase
MATQNATMDWPRIYRERRNEVRKAVPDGVILWLGHVLQARNYAGNTYNFRQNSHFLYYTGLAVPDLAVLSFPEADNDILFAQPGSIEDIVWSGAGLSRMELAGMAGIETVEDISRLGVYLTKAVSQGKKIHYLPVYQATSIFRTAELLVLEPSEAAAGASRPLQEAAARQRSVKSDPEIAEIESALAVSAEMYRTALNRIRPGAFEYEIAGAIQGAALERNCEQAYPPIVTIHGEILHNHAYHHRLEDGQLLLIDAGAEAPSGYAADITRTYPVNGRFRPEQKEIYNLVLKAQMSAIPRIKPGTDFRDVHRYACLTVAEGLTSLGLMKGNPEDAVAAGAHALFLPHGVGHMLGLDVHDMEDLGDIVGYVRGEKRSAQFGLNYLRLSRPLHPGYVLTVEPGIYFIPALMDRWRQEGFHTEFINYEKVDSYRGFGGIRIEDNVAVTETGCRVLGPGIPKEADEIESLMEKR